jgi:nucleoid-associated protein YgaU
LQSITLFLAIVAAVPLLRAILGLTLVAISETLKLENQSLKRMGLKLMPAFLRASLGLGLVIGFTSPASAETTAPQIPVIDRVIDFEVETQSPSQAPSETVPVVETEKPAETSTPLATYTVKSGDSLWSIAQERVVGTNASVDEIDQAWRAIWKANKSVIGNNPSLIRPGQEIKLNVKTN